MAGSKKNKAKSGRVLGLDSQNPLSVIEAAERSGRDAFIVLGGNLSTPSAYRSNLQRQFTAALTGNVSKSARAEAYGYSAAGFAATNYRAQVISDIPLGVFQKGGGLADWSPVPHFLNTFSTLAWNIEASLIIYGVCYLRKIYNDYNYPVMLEWIHPDDVSPQTDVDGNVEMYYIDAVPYQPFQMVELRTFDPQRSLDGKSEFEVALSRLITEQAIIKHAGSFFFNAARPDGMLLSKTKLSPVDRKRAEEEWKKFKGTENAWRTFVSSGQWEWIPLTVNPVQLAMVELSTKNDRDILAIMKVNPALLGFADVVDPLSAGSTMREIKRNHIEDVALPRFNWICRQINEQWLHADFDFGDYYSLGANKAAMPILSDVNQERATTAATLTGAGSVLVDHDEARGTMGLAERGKEYLARSPLELNQVWLNAGMTLDQYRKMLGLDPFGIYGGDLVRLPTGELIKMIDLPKAAEAMLARLIQSAQPPPAPAPMTPPAAPQFIIPPGGWGQPQSAPPAPLAPPAVAALPPPPPDTTLTKIARLLIHSKRSGGATNEAAVLLSFQGNRQLEAIQTIVAAYMPPDLPPPELTPPDDFHITLFMAESLTPQAEQSLYELLGDMPPVELETGEIGTFPPGDDGKTPVVLFLADNERMTTLKGYQAALYNKALEVEPGAVMSDYSKPDDWIPHITLAYIMGAFEPPALKAPLHIIPTAVDFSRKVYDITYTAPTLPAGNSPAVEVEAEPTQRAGQHIRMAFIWPENNFILMAQRIAANALQAVGVAGVEWQAPRNWALTLAEFDGSAGQANQLLNKWEPGDTARMELKAYSFEIVGRSIYLMCAPADNLSRANASIRLQLEDEGITTTPAFVPGIKLGELATDNPNDLMDIHNTLQTASGQLGMDLLAEHIDMQVNGESRNSWELRTHSARQKRELTDWKNKSTGIHRKDSASFTTSALNGSIVESYIRAALAETDPDDLPAVKDVFTRAQRLLTDGVNYLEIPDAPDEYESYWSNFDNLDANLGQAWLNYMAAALPSVLALVETDTAPTGIYKPLNALHDQLTAEWVGTPEKPGALYKLILAGMAAGNEALKGAVSMNPNGRAEIAPQPLAITVDWALLNQQAYDFARQYSYKLIRGLDQTSQTQVQTAMTDWLKSGEGKPGLIARLTPIFKNTERADAIASTESIRVYNEGAFKRWEDVGVTQAVWRTVQDTHVCPICRPLNGQVADIRTGWIHPGGSFIDPYDNRRIDSARFKGKVYRDSAHTRCRCYRRPVVIRQLPGSDKPIIDTKTETVSKTKKAGVRMDDLLKQVDVEYEQIRTAVQKAGAKTSELKQRQTDLAAQRRALQDTNFEDFKILKTLEYDDPKAVAARARREEIYSQIEAIRTAELENQKALEKEQKASRKAIIKSLSTPTEYRTEAAAAAAFGGNKKKVPSAPMMKKNTEAQSWLGAVMDGEQYTDTLKYTVKKEGKRAFFTSADDSINMRNKNEVDTYIHEIGHAIEDKYPDVHQRCIEFLEYRAKGESPEKMSVITGNKAYRADEIAIRDNFVDEDGEQPYTGKIYKNSAGEYVASEILSMGLQQMYRDAAGFAARDPEYFNFILSIMRRAT